MNCKQAPVGPGVSHGAPKNIVLNIPRDRLFNTSQAAAEKRGGGGVQKSVVYQNVTP